MLLGLRQLVFQLGYPSLKPRAFWTSCLGVLLCHDCNSVASSPPGGKIDLVGREPLRS